ncbi:MAG: DUF389 domain-containing protein [Bacteroidia bacterium]|nr:DUF389 domain-containing protein [Bacteroidia bacterium]MBT8269068.1 DUF389 domain-containing protein [Bacteroidia bacterium]NNF81500.1 DUF389 domain-containing protein [Flavobacteriaceae bacterium]NNK69861.1 DUF389 domain-containing protein [Flavobacteriaceae bacterium]
MEESKFNFSEEDQNHEKKVEQSKQAVKEDAKGLMASSRNFLMEIFSFRKDTDRDATIEAIKADIPFKGATAWILICSIFVASVGLNANSTAVVIGAMLISPLMGPILGIGMSIAINDIDTLRKSLINFAVMVVLSVLTAYLFFELFPLNEDSSELLGRTRPDIRDVLIAFFGGLALIIARTKKGTIASVIFGVAIATALMPPLCTVGYGLAKGAEPGLTEGSTGFTYALGAMYLFTINTIFIALATFLVLKFLRFSMLKYANSRKRKFIARMATLTAIVIMIPAIWTFLNVYKESKQKNEITKFINNEIRGNQSLELLRYEVDYKNKEILLSFLNEITEPTKNDLINEIKNNPLYTNIRDYEPMIKGSGMNSYELISTAYQDTRNELMQSRNVIDGLQLQIEGLEQEISDLNFQMEQQRGETGIAFSTLSKEAKIRFPELEYFAYSEVLASSNFIKIDTLKVAQVKWNQNLNDSLVSVRERDLSIWIKGELKVADTVYVNRME